MLKIRPLNFTALILTLALGVSATAAEPTGSLPPDRSDPAVKISAEIAKAGMVKLPGLVDGWFELTAQHQASTRPGEIVNGFWNFLTQSHYLIGSSRQQGATESQLNAIRGEIARNYLAKRPGLLSAYIKAGGSPNLVLSVDAAIEPFMAQMISQRDYSVGQSRHAEYVHSLFQQLNERTATALAGKQRTGILGLTDFANLRQAYGDTLGRLASLAASGKWNANLINRALNEWIPKDFIRADVAADAVNFLQRVRDAEIDVKEATEAAQQDPKNKKVNLNKAVDHLRGLTQSLGPDAPFELTETSKALAAELAKNADAAVQAQVARITPPLLGQPAQTTPQARTAKRGFFGRNGTSGPAPDDINLDPNKDYVEIRDPSGQTRNYAELGTPAENAKWMPSKVLQALRAKMAAARKRIANMKPGQRISDAYDNTARTTKAPGGPDKSFGLVEPLRGDPMQWISRMENPEYRAYMGRVTSNIAIQSASFYAAVLAMALVSCHVSYETHPACMDQIMYMLSSPAFWAVGPLFGAGQAATIASLQAFGQGRIPSVVVHTLGIGAGLFLADFGTQFLSDISVCLKAFGATDDTTQSAMQSRCDSAFQKWSVDNKIVEYIPHVASIAIASGLYMGASAAVMKYIRAVQTGQNTGGRMSIILRGFELGARAAEHGSWGVRVALGIVPTIIVLGTYHVIQSQIEEPYAKTIIGLVPLDHWVSWVLKHVPPGDAVGAYIAHLAGASWGDTSKLREYLEIWTGTPQHLNQPRVARTVWDAEDKVIKQLDPWSQRGFQDPENINKGPAIFSGDKDTFVFRPAYQDYVDEYLFQQHRWRSYTITAASNVWNEWQNSLALMAASYAATRAVYQGILIEMATRKARGITPLIPDDFIQNLPKHNRLLIPGLVRNLQDAIGNATTPHIAHVALANAACGFTSFEAKRSKSWKDSPAIRRPSVSADGRTSSYIFRGPRLSGRDGGSICDLGTARVASAMSPDEPMAKTNLTWEWRDSDGQTYPDGRGLLDYLEKTIPPELYAADITEREDADHHEVTVKLRNFDDWWNRQVGDRMQDFWDHYQDLYQDVLKKEYFPRLFDDTFFYCTDEKHGYWATIANKLGIGVGRWDAIALQIDDPRCQETSYRLSDKNGPWRRRTRLPNGLFAALREESRMNWEILEYIHLSKFTDPRTREAERVKFRLQESAFFSRLEVLPPLLTGDTQAIAQAGLLANPLLGVSTLMGFDLDVAKECADLSTPVPPDKKDSDSGDEKKPTDLSVLAPETKGKFMTTEQKNQKCHVVDPKELPRSRVAMTLIDNLWGLKEEMEAYGRLVNGVGDMLPRYRDIKRAQQGEDIEYPSPDDFKYKSWRQQLNEGINKVFKKLRYETTDEE